jgi:putative tryptophan/tyrosine transport system substrate-binding protein
MRENPRRRFEASTGATCEPLEGGSGDGASSGPHWRISQGVAGSVSDLGYTENRMARTILLSLQFFSITTCRALGAVVRRRDFITVVAGSIITRPLAARAQQSALPAVGFLNTVSAAPFARMADGFRQGLHELGYAEGQNVTIEYRWAEGHIDQLPALATDLVDRQVAVIAATGGPAAGLAAKAATSTIPIVFVSGADPVKAGLIASFNRPGGNITGISPLSSALGSKRLEILHTLVSKVTAIGILVNPNYDAAVQVHDAQVAADALALQVKILNASSVAEIDAAFASLKQQAIRPTGCLDMEHESP